MLDSPLANRYSICIDTHKQQGDTVMQNEIQILMDQIVDSYVDWQTRSNPDSTASEIRQEMMKEFADGISYKPGKKYGKIITNGSVWGFVVLTDNDAKFKKGDILKAARWAAPARNFARGNVFDGKYNVYWTGAM